MERTSALEKLRSYLRTRGERTAAVDTTVGTDTLAAEQRQAVDAYELRAAQDRSVEVAPATELPQVHDGSVDFVLRPEVQVSSRFADIVGSSRALESVLGMVEKVAPTTASVLITGETGTGKEAIARALHAHSPRHAGPLICVNCPAIPATLAESELFGHERGAFTNATDTRPGKFELAHRGTIFLDEVADLPVELQVKLLRVLQERETQRVGGRTAHKLDFRVVAATNRDLDGAMRAGSFREDLYYRLTTVHIHLPTLRERPEDIPMLATFFCERAVKIYEKPVRGFTVAAMSALRRHYWPGNVRELQHVVERAVLLCTDDVIRDEHLPRLGRSMSAANTAATAPILAHHSLGTALREEKRRQIAQALIRTRGNQAAAARLLGISRSNLCRLLKRLELKTGSGSVEA